MSQAVGSAAGVVVEPKPASGTGDSSYSKVASNLIGAASSYLPWSASSANEPKEQTRERITWCSFDYCELGDERRLCLLLAYRNSYSKGFQAWDMSDPQHAREVISNRDENIKAAKFLPTPLDDRKEDVRALRPLLAVLSADKDRKDRQGVPLKNAVRLYSMQAHRMVSAPSLKFDSEVQAVDCNRRVLCVVLRKVIHILSAADLSRTRVLDTFPSLSPFGVFSLGSRWVAYPANKELSATDEKRFEEEVARNPEGLDMVDVGTKVGTSVASGIMYLGEMTSKAVSTYYYGESSGALSSREAMLAKQKADGMVVAAAGSVAVHDLEDDRELIQIRVDSQPLGALAFDGSGTMLAAATVCGRHVHVLKIMSRKGVTSYSRLYKIRRGITNASIQRLLFSFDSSWLAFGSSHGTWHFYATRREGGPVNVESHPPLDKKVAVPHPTVSYGQPLLPGASKEAAKLVWLSASTRIRLGAAESADGDSEFVPLAACFLPSEQNGVLVVNSTGVVQQRQILPEPQVLPNGKASKELTVSNTCSLEWDLCRKRTWPTVQSAPEALFAKQSGVEEVVGTAAFLPSMHETRWLSQLEMVTYSEDFKPLYSIPKFHFKRFQEEDEVRDNADLLASKIEATASIFEPIQMAESIVIKRKEPLPFKERPPPMTHVETKPDDRMDASEAGMGPLSVEDDIRKALETPLPGGEPVYPSSPQPDADASFAGKPSIKMDDSYMDDLELTEDEAVVNLKKQLEEAWASSDL